MELTQDLSDEDKYEEEWKVVLNNGSEYRIGKNQSRLIQDAIAGGNRGIIMFKTFSISIPYIVEFFREKRFLKDGKLLPERATEEEYKPISKEKWIKFKDEAYKNIGKKSLLH